MLFWLVGCVIASSGALWAQESLTKPPLIISGATNLVAAANGGSVVSVTSQADEEYWNVKNLIDGGVQTNGWASASATFPQDILFTFKNRETHLINRIVIDPTTPDWPFLGRTIKDFELHVSTEKVDGPYKRVLSGTVKNERKRQEFLFNAVEAKFVRLHILSNHGSDRWVALGEVEIYEAIPGTSVLDQLIARLEQLLIDLKNYRETLLKEGVRGAEIPQITTPHKKPTPEKETTPQKPNEEKSAAPNQPAGGK